MIRDAVILGAGAAGLMCAMTAGRRGFSCAVIDHSPVAGRKCALPEAARGMLPIDIYLRNGMWVSRRGFLMSCSNAVRRILS